MPTASPHRGTRARRPGSVAVAALAALAIGAAGCAPGIAPATAEPPREADLAAPLVELPDTPLRPAPAPHRRFDPALADRVDHLVSRAQQLTGQPVHLTVLNDDGATVVDHEGDDLVLPASTMKIVTAAAALTALGPDHRYVTPIVATTEVGPAGILDGDLVVIGSGDPVLATPRYGADVSPDRPRTPLEGLADAVVAAGINHVNGAVIGDGSVFAHEPIASGWQQEYLDDLDARPVAGLTVDAGLHVEYEEGRVPQGKPVDDLPAETASQLVGLLLERGVTVAGGARSGTAPDEGTVPIGEVASPPLVDILAYLTRNSDNQLADGVFRTLGALDGEPSTWAGSAAAVRSALEGIGLQWDGVTIADGSGLSREDRLTARFLARLDLAMTSSDSEMPWRDLLAVAGRNGTLRKRLRGTVAEGRLLGKTGTLDDVRALVGRIEGSHGSYHFAVLGNDLNGDSAWRLYELQDQLAIALVARLDGCQRVDDPPPDPEPTPPPFVTPYHLVCPT